MPIVQAFHRVNQSGVPVPELKGTIDLIFAREPRPTSESTLPFRIFDGKKLVPIADYLLANPRPDLIRLEERMLGLGAGPYGHRAGDVLLLTHSGLNHPVENRFYFSNVNRSWHGSPTAQDSHIPFVLARRGDSGTKLQGMINRVAGKAPSHLHVVPLLHCLTGLEVPHERMQADC